MCQAKGKEEISVEDFSEYLYLFIREDVDAEVLIKEAHLELLR